MPNYVYNTVTFNPEDVEKVKALVCTPGVDESFDFDKIIPMPKTLSIVSGSSTYAAIDFLNGRFDKIKDYPDEGDFPDVDKFLDSTTHPSTLPELAVYASIVQYNFAAYGASDWYTWRNRHWNTKWNACEPYWCDNVCHFDTAWSSPDPVFLELSKKLGIRFTVESEEESLEFCSITVFNNGEIENEELAEGVRGLALLGYSLEDVLARYDYYETEEDKQRIIDEYNAALNS